MIRWLVVFVLGGFFFSCQSPKEKESSTENEQDTNEKPHGASWGYSGTVGPENWAAIQGEYSPCRDGKHQSPVNLISEGLFKEHNLQFDYHPSQEVILNNGHTVELVFEGGSFLDFDEKKYQLLQFHFHTPSEHLVDKRHYPLEMHLVHRSMDTTYLVVGLLFDYGSESEFLDKFLMDAPDEVEEKTYQKDIDIMDLHPEDKGYYYYNGSFTTPPCTEGVRWLIKKGVLGASKEQIDRLESIEGENFRPDQSLNDRHVEEF